MASERQGSASLSAGTQRKRAAIDAGAGLVLTMLLWPFPIARAMLTPAVNVASVLLAWLIVNTVYHVVLVRVWRCTAGTYLLGLDLVSAAGSDTPTTRELARWAWLSGLLVVPTVVWPGFSAGVRHWSGIELAD